MTQPQSLHDKLMSQGGAAGRSASFPTLGTIVKGYIVAVGEAPDLDMNTKQPRTFPDGSPKPPLMTVTLQTEERDPADSEDDGQRVLYLKWKILEAVQAAVKASGGVFNVGGYLAVQYSADGERNPQKPHLSPPKLYVAAYQPPAAAAVAPMAPPAAPVAAPVAPPVAAPAPQPAAFNPASLLPPQ